jgi:hypothetical protein
MPSRDFPIRGEFHELPGNPPDLEARRQAFRAVMRRLLTITTPDPEHCESDDEERPDEAA